MKYGIGSRVRLTTTLKGTFVQATITDESLQQGELWAITII